MYDTTDNAYCGEKNMIEYFSDGRVRYNHQIQIEGAKAELDMWGMDMRGQKQVTHKSLTFSKLSFYSS